MGKDNIWDRFVLTLELLAFLNKLIDNRTVRKGDSGWSSFGFWNCQVGWRSVRAVWGRGIEELETWSVKIFLNDCMQVFLDIFSV